MNELISEHAELIASTVVLVLPIVLCVLIAISFVLFRSLKLTSQQLQDLHAAVELNAVSQTSVTEALNHFELTFARITERNAELQTQSHINSSVEEASRLARRGAPAQALVESCGLSDSEAELMVHLHRRMQA